ncbi:transglutaminase domain-containing protein [Streptomyces sp. NPDC051997]
MVSGVIDYVQQSPITVLDPSQHWLLDGLPDDPLSICRSAQNLVLSPEDAAAVGVPKDRLNEQRTRPVRHLIAVLTRLLPEPLGRPRPLEVRVVGTSRHSAALACSLLRAQGYAARVRCGFRNTSRETPRMQWTAEWWSKSEERWIRMDPDPESTGLPADAGEASFGFATAGEAWQLYRSGSLGQPGGKAPGADSAHTSFKISAGVVRDLAALCKLEMLPTDTWGRMAMPQHGFTSVAYLNLIDVVASLCVQDEPAGLARLFASVDLAVPPHMIDPPTDA